MLVNCALTKVWLSPGKPFAELSANRAISAEATITTTPMTPERKRADRFFLPAISVLP